MASVVAAPAVRTLRRTRVASRRATRSGSLAPTYGIAFAITAADVAFVPLLPTLRDSLALSGAAAGVLLAATMGAMLVLAVPLGILVDRIGARPLLAVAGVLVVAACAGLALATTFATLFASAPRCWAWPSRSCGRRRRPGSRPRRDRRRRPAGCSPPAAREPWSRRCSAASWPARSASTRRSRCWPCSRCPWRWC